MCGGVFNVLELSLLDFDIAIHLMSVCVLSSFIILSIRSKNTVAGQALETTRSCGITSEFSRIVARLFLRMEPISATTSQTERETDIASISYRLLGRLRKIDGALLRLLWLDCYSQSISILT